jgi:hypothetical protein
VNSASPQHIFFNHLLPQQHALPQVRETQELIWPSLFLLSCFALLVLIKVTSFPKVVKVIQSCFSMQTLRQLEREDFNTFKFYSVALTAFFLFNLSFFIYRVNLTYQFVLTEEPLIAQFLFFMLVTVFFFFIKNGFTRLLAVFVDDNKLIPEFLYSSFIISQTLGIIIFPLMVLAELSAFDPLIFVSATGVILIAMQGFKWYRGIVFALIENRVGFLQIFTYFCSLEILLVLVLVKFIIEKF